MKSRPPRKIKLAVMVTFLALTPSYFVSQRAALAATHSYAQKNPVQTEDGAEHQAQMPAKPAAKEQQPDEQNPQQQKPAQPQQEHHHDMQAQTEKEVEKQRDTSKQGDEHSGHDMSNMHAAHNMNSMMSTITGGPFKSMAAIGSGTSLLPSSPPGYMWHWMKGDWMIMAHGNLIAGFNHQGGPRGVNKAESQNWFMLMAERGAGGGQLMFC